MEHNFYIEQNLLPRHLDVTSLKLWQRLCAAYVCIDTFMSEFNGETSRNGKLEYAEKTYQEYAARIVQDCSHVIPGGMTADVLCQQTLSKHGSRLTGRQIWDTIWDTMNRYIVQKMLPTWKTVQQGNDSLPIEEDLWFLGNSPLDLLERGPKLLELRKRLFDQEFNSLSTSPKENEQKNENDGDIENDDERQSKRIKLTSEGGGSGSSKKKEFDIFWFPVEWLAFIAFGPLANKPFFQWAMDQQLQQGNFLGIPPKKFCEQHNLNVKLLTSTSSKTKKGSTIVGGMSTPSPLFTHFQPLRQQPVQPLPIAIQQPLFGTTHNINMSAPGITYAPASAMLGGIGTFQQPLIISSSALGMLPNNTHNQKKAKANASAKAKGAKPLTAAQLAQQQQQAKLAATMPLLDLINRQLIFTESFPDDMSELTCDALVKMGNDTPASSSTSNGEVLTPTGKRQRQPTPIPAADMPTSDGIPMSVALPFASAQPLVRSISSTPYLGGVVRTGPKPSRTHTTGGSIPLIDLSHSHMNLPLNQDGTVQAFGIPGVAIHSPISMHRGPPPQSMQGMPMMPIQGLPLQPMPMHAMSMQGMPVPVQMPMGMPVAVPVPMSMPMSYPSGHSLSYPMTTLQPPPLPPSSSSCKSPAMPSSSSSNAIPLAIASSATTVSSGRATPPIPTPPTAGTTTLASTTLAVPTAVPTHANPMKYRANQLYPELDLLSSAIAATPVMPCDSVAVVDSTHYLAAMREQSRLIMIQTKLSILEKLVMPEEERQEKIKELFHELNMVQV